MLCEPEPGMLWSQAPMVWFKPVPKHTPPRDTYPCPLYRTAERRGQLLTTGHSTNYLLDVDLPCTRTPAHWTQRGTCLLLERD